MSTERTAHILDAAYRCFARHGVRRTTMEDIAREAGLSRGAVYQYVRNKDDAYRRVAERLFDEALAASRDAAGAAGSLSERLTAILMAKLELVLRIARDSPHAAELFGEQARLIADLDARYMAAMTDLLASAVRASRPSSTDPADDAELAHLLLALTRGLEADLSDPLVPVRRLRHGVALLVAGAAAPLDQESP
ncbi:TetR/AcrR family transcriptional regulator [Streptomyces sp. NPDC058576]|uniref:TetR/AcrR family transcriptional regulator n=1 Tax=Streptomyces sp. NPDC058576 TaxID=3346547 RepID=UPI0036669197